MEHQKNIQIVDFQFSIHYIGAYFNLFIQQTMRFILSFYLGPRRPGKLNNWRLECGLASGALEQFRFVVFRSCRRVFTIKVASFCLGVQKKRFENGTFAKQHILLRSNPLFINISSLDISCKYLGGERVRKQNILHLECRLGCCTLGRFRFLVPRF